MPDGLKLILFIPAVIVAACAIGMAIGIVFAGLGLAVPHVGHPHSEVEAEQKGKDGIYVPGKPQSLPHR